MADNVAITAGTGTTIAADDVGGGVLHQRVKLTWGVDGTGTDASASNPLPVVQTGTHNIGTVTAVTAISNALPAGTNNIGDVDVLTIAAGETHLGEVGGKVFVKTITMTADTSAMGAADIIADTQQLDAALRKTDGTGVLQSLTVFDPDDNTAFAFDVYIHNTSTSMGSENSGITITDANAAAGIIGVVSFAVTDVKDLINGKMYHKANIGLPVSAVSGTDDLYFSIVNGAGTPTFAGGSIPMRVGILLD
jgi:hypothetical protein